MGAAAALVQLAPDKPFNAPLDKLLDPIWQHATADASVRERVLQSITKARSRLADWHAAGHPDPDAFFKE